MSATATSTGTVGGSGEPGRRLARLISLPPPPRREAMRRRILVPVAREYPSVSVTELGEALRGTAAALEAEAGRVR